MVDGFPTKILAATDGSEHAVLAAQAAADLARHTGAELNAVHVRQVPRLATTLPALAAGEYSAGRERWEQEARALPDEQADRGRDGRRPRGGRDGHLPQKSTPCH